MNFGEIISQWSFPVAIFLVFGFAFWKFWIQPRMNEGLPIEPPKESEDFNIEEPHPTGDFFQS